MKVYTGQKDVKFTGAVADMLSDAEYKQIVGRSYTGGDVVVATSVTTGVNTTLGITYHTGSKTVRVVQISDPQNVSISVRYAIIAGGLG